ncbi:hypothetical protein STEG23_001297 [Scotinomys teguina]
MSSPTSCCDTDGVFGRCQKVPAMDTYRYEVSPGALLHLRVTLQKLSRTVLDDAMLSAGRELPLMSHSSVGTVC